MNHILEQAKQRLYQEDFTCVMCKGDLCYTSRERGVKPLLTWLEQEMDCTGFSAADKVVGKGAAFLYVLLGVKEVYASIISQAALDLLEKHGIATTYDSKVNAIINRAGTGPCPMEEATKDCESPQYALAAIKNTLRKLRQSS